MKSVNALKREISKKIWEHKQRRIRSTLIGRVIEMNYDVLDQAKIGKDIYVLAQDQNDKYCIMKYAPPEDFIRLFGKKVLESKTKFEKPGNWIYHSALEIDSYGTVVNVRNEK